MAARSGPARPHRHPPRRPPLSRPGLAATVWSGFHRVHEAQRDEGVPTGPVKEADPPHVVCVVGWWRTLVDVSVLVDPELPIKRVPRENPLVVAEVVKREGRRRLHPPILEEIRRAAVEAVRNIHQHSGGRHHRVQGPMREAPSPYDGDNRSARHLDVRWRLPVRYPELLEPPGRQVVVRPVDVRRLAVALAARAASRATSDGAGIPSAR